MRLAFRWLREEHLETVRRWRTSAEVSKYLYSDPVLSAEDQRVWYRRIAADPSCLYWVVTAEDTPVGLVSISAIQRVHKRCDWAYYIADPSMRGKGLGKIIEYNVQRFVFESLGLNKLCCEVFSFNEHVIQIHVKYGNRIEGTRRQHIWKSGEFHDIVEMALLKAEWLELEKQREPYPLIEFELRRELSPP
ncbi:MAG: UDP-4-amino-4,6-dideoxy-N-acetyl-beta-L-altrosamine N-acetyltransferase [Deltaproteobacteria bacterium]|nr:UDP-4-amino-4,6-dideoxy-N-acetyl-beta-L-altrosamine N-acetyltransferase [Deltaproteobacteria bacterium]